MTIDDVAKHFKVSRRTIERWIDAKLFKVKRLTKRTIRIDAAEIKRFEERRTK
jgi:excisionase family DNA binding protein